MPTRSLGNATLLAAAGQMTRTRDLAWIGRHAQVSLLTGEALAPKGSNVAVHAVREA